MSGPKPRFYRYRDTLYENEGLVIRCDEYVGIKRTRVSWWIVPEWAEFFSEEMQKHYRKRVEDFTPRPGILPPKRFAYASKEHALQSYRIRKEAQEHRARTQLKTAQEAQARTLVALERLKAGEEDLFPNIAAMPAPWLTPEFGI